jgi:catechol 2,3-dioxygenase-like lactoylglutathione lyase family enzyme
MMPLNRLDHVTVLCADVERSRSFYHEVLGMVDGDRPPFNFPGAWLYVDGRPVVHLVGGRNKGELTTTGSVDHVAFVAHDLDGMRQQLNAKKIPFREVGVPGRALHQVFLRDPDGVMIELTFQIDPAK